MYKRRGQHLIHLFGLTAGLFLVWILLSGKFETRFFLIGLGSSLVVSVVCLPLLMIKNPRTGKEFFVLRINYLKLIPYGLWVIKEIFKSTLDVSREILKVHIDYEPRIIYFSMPFENPMASVILANSIILTPGTITVDVMEGGIFEVHAIDKKAAEDMLSGTMPRKVASLFGEKCEFRAFPEAEVLEIPKEVQ
ncbi:MAG: Na+/H+ antiporter subunit E [Anaerovoracaceae bacterium]